MFIDSLFSSLEVQIEYFSHAYCGSSNNKAIGLLMWVAASNVNNDFRRAGVIVFFRISKQSPSVVSLLSELTLIWP